MGDNMDEIIAQVTTILNTEAEEIFNKTESDQPVSIELPNIPSTDDPSTLGLGEVLVVNVLGDLGDDNEKIETAKKDLESGLRVYTEDSEEVVGPAYYIELTVRGQEVDNANIYYDTNVLKDLDTSRRKQAEIIRNLVIEAWGNGVKLDVETEEE